MVEHATENRGVVSPILTLGTRQLKFKAFTIRESLEYFFTREGGIMTISSLVFSEKGSSIMDITQYLPLLIPLVVIQLGLQIYALIDLSKREKVKGPKWAWVLGIVLGQLIGPIVYLLFGRVEE